MIPKDWNDKTFVEVSISNLFPKSVSIRLTICNLSLIFWSFTAIYNSLMLHLITEFDVVDHCHQKRYWYFFFKGKIKAYIILHNYQYFCLLLISFYWFSNMSRFCSHNHAHISWCSMYFRSFTTASPRFNTSSSSWSNIS